jgi:DNA-binding MarR family transcriptional regulator
MKTRPYASHIKDVASLPLTALLSQALVAFTIECDNEFEYRAPHRTTVGRGKTGPWLTSMVMYSNLLRLTPESGITVRELERRARTPKLQINGMERWGYILVAPDLADKRAKPPQRDWLVMLTSKGRIAKDIWAEIPSEVEARWSQRFGGDAVSELRASLGSIVGSLGRDLPEYLPVLGYGLTAEVLPQVKSDERPGEDPTQMTVPALLSRVLLAFALEFESLSPVSLPICANILRLLGADPLPVRDLPRRSGVSKEAIAMAVGFLQAKKYAAVDADPARARGKAIKLTANGLEAQETHGRLCEEIEQRWQREFGWETIDHLRQSLLKILSATDGDELLLLRGMEPYPEGWRAKIPRPATLPHYPVVLHRGGYPDGS